MRDLASFLQASPVAGLAADTLLTDFGAAGFRLLREEDSWSLGPGDACVVRRLDGGLMAFRIPSVLSPEDLPRFAIAGAHTDSPGFRLRNRGVEAFDSVCRVGVEMYGSPIVSTWLDRDLAIAGRVFCRDSGQGPLSIRFKDIRATIANAAIHLNRDINKGFEYNAHTHLRALVAAHVPERMLHRALLWLCERELGLEEGTVLDADLWLCDPGTVVSLGEHGWIQAPRLDNLAGCHALASALISTGQCSCISLAAFFDHEEIGSTSSTGADSAFFATITRRILLALGHGEEAFYRSMARSFLVSVDAAHGFHPAYPEKMDGAYAPRIGAGIVVKTNVNHKYAGDLPGRASMTELWRQAGIPLQYFTNRADLGCGSTIGPMAEALGGLATMDVGIPLWAMHSIRETASQTDQASMIKAIAILFEGRIP